MSRFVSAPTHNHIVAAKNLLHYLNRAQNLGLRLTGPKDHRNTANISWGSVDSYLAGCPDTGKSTTGFILMLNGAAIAWKSKHQTIIALSTAIADFVVASTTSMIREIVPAYVRRLLDSLGFP